MESTPLRLFCLAASAELGAGISAALAQPLAAHEEREFEDGEHKARPLDAVNGADVYVVQILHDINVCAIHGIERTCLVFAVLEFALFMSRQRLSQCRRNPSSQFGAGSQTKQPQGCAFHCPVSTYGMGDQAALLTTDAAAWVIRADCVFPSALPCSPAAPSRPFPRHRSRASLRPSAHNRRRARCCDGNKSPG